MSKHRLSFDDEYEFISFGLSCHLRDYRLAWHLNNSFGLNFIRFPLTTTASGSIEEYSMYKTKDEDNHWRFVLITNHNDSNYFHKKHRSYDYLLFIEGYLEFFDPERFKAKLRELEGMQLVVDLNPEDFHDAQYILFEE